MNSFFFSSRRRHTRWPRDWSSDVCSSDLDRVVVGGAGDPVEVGALGAAVLRKDGALMGEPVRGRSEERRVGKECRSGGWPVLLKRVETRGDHETPHKNI